MPRQFSSLLFQLAITLVLAFIALTSASTLQTQPESLISPSWNWSTVNFNPKNGTDGFTALHRLDDGCIILAAKRSSTNEYRLGRADICAEPDITFHPIGVKGYSGAHTYYFDSHNSTVIASTGDTGNPCIIRSTDKGKTWSTIVGSGAFKTTGAVFSPLHLGFGEWIIFQREESNNRYILRSLDDGVTWSKDLNTRGLLAGPRRVQLFNNKLYYSGTFANHFQGQSGLYISQDKGRTWTITLAGHPIFAGVTVTSFGTELAGEHNYSTPEMRQLVNLWRRVPGHDDWVSVLQAKANTDMFYFREVIELNKPGHLLAFLANNEDSQQDKDLKVYYSQDDGKSWIVLPPIVMDIQGKGWEVNAIYQTLSIKDPKNRGTDILLAAAQPHDYILRLDYSGLSTVLEDSQHLVIPKLRRWDGGMP